MVTTAVSLAALLASSAVVQADPFLPSDDVHRWGFKAGIQVAIHPYPISGGGDGGPRGLLRIGYPILPDRKAALLNFIAVEPVVNGRRAYSELEQSADGKQGKLITLREAKRERRGKDELLRVGLDVERFGNGARVRLEVIFRSSAPDEIELRAYAADGSAVMEECALTATMGNYARLRRVHLAGRVLESGAVFKEFLPNGFTPDHLVPARELAKNRAGDIVVPAVPDEKDPRILQESLPKDYWWRYPGIVLTQYWRAPHGSYSPDLKLRLNGRHTYWMSKTPIPGGVAFENFELRDRFKPGQPFVFGVTTRGPEEVLRAARE